MTATVAPLAAADLSEATRIFRVAFGTFLGAPDPENFWTDRDYIAGRRRAPHVASFAAHRDGQFVGSNFATRWGSVGFFGPITVRPELQNAGIAQALLTATVEQFDAWGCTHSGLFTFAQSAKHIGLYRKFGFYPRFLTAIMAAPAADHAQAGWSRYSTLSAADQAAALAACREVADSIYPGLDLTDEIQSAQEFGDTMLVEGPRGIAAFAICHYGPSSEAGADTCFIKFGAVRDTATAGADYQRLLDACESLSVAVGMGTVLAGTNLARQEAYEALAARGYRTAIQGVNMHRRNEAGYCRPGVYAIDDWR